MDYQELHAWNVEPGEAIRIQRELQTQVRVEKLTKPVRLIAGADISFEKYSDTVYAGFVVIDMRTLDVVARATVVTEAKFPYIPGLLSFREAPTLLEAWRKLDVEPDVVMFDGQGIAHPRRLGIAAHMGLCIDRPSIGCAKSILVGRYQDLSEAAGSYVALIDKGEPVGVALRTKDKVNPVFISIGNRIDLESAIKITMSTVKGYRIPEPTRQAHLLVNEMRRNFRF